MTTVAVGIRPGEARHFFKLIRMPAALAAIPLIWMLIQLSATTDGGLSRSIWQSAASALNTSLSTSISIDPGLTLIALCRFTSLAAIAFVAAAVSIERQRAEILLLCGQRRNCHIALPADLTCLMSSMLKHAISMTAGSIGIILFVAGAIMIIERYEIRRHPHGFLARLLIPSASSLPV